VNYRPRTLFSFRRSGALCAPALVVFAVILSSGGFAFFPGALGALDLLFDGLGISQNNREIGQRRGNAWKRLQKSKDE
jgi:hypothetical protein